MDKAKTHPVALDDVMYALKGSIGNDRVSGKTFDIGGPEVMTYKEIMIDTAEVMGKKRKLVNIPFMSVNLSRLWVTVTTGTPKEMVYPLIESLVHPMVAKPEQMDDELSYGAIPFKEAAKLAIEQEDQEKAQKQESPQVSKKQIKPIVSDVRSVQRVTLPPGKNAAWQVLITQHGWRKSGSRFLQQIQIRRIRARFTY